MTETEQGKDVETPLDNLIEFRLSRREAIRREIVNYQQLKDECDRELIALRAARDAYLKEMEAK